MRPKSPRLAVRAIIVHEARLLLVNAWPDGKSPLMCAPGGGVEPGASLPDNLQREVREETGLQITVGAPCLVNEFHDPTRGFHQVELFFRCHVTGSAVIPHGWQDPEAVVTNHVWASAGDLAAIPHKPSSLGAVAFDPEQRLSYDALERIVR